MGEPPAPSTIKTYFGSSYPERTAPNASLFRTGALERARIISEWLPPLAGKSLCDVGCGDGDQIVRILREKNGPARLTLQDISEVMVRRAKLRLRGSAIAVSESIGDAFVDGIDAPHDVVIATGVTDYYPNWVSVLDTLWQSTSEILIVDFPRSWKLRNIPRRLWLRRNGLLLHTASLREVRELTQRLAGRIEVAPSAYNWMVRIQRKR